MVATLKLWSFVAVCTNLYFFPIAWGTIVQEATNPSLFAFNHFCLFVLPRSKDVYATATYHWKTLTLPLHCIIRTFSYPFFGMNPWQLSSLSRCNCKRRFIHAYTVIATRIISKQSTHTFLLEPWSQEICFHVCKALLLPVLHKTIHHFIN